MGLEARPACPRPRAEGPEPALDGLPLALALAGEKSEQGAAPAVPPPCGLAISVFSGLLETGLVLKSRLWSAV